MKLGLLKAAVFGGTLALTACQVPVASDHSMDRVQMVVSIKNPPPGTVSASRVLLPNTSTLTLVATSQNHSDTQKTTVSLTSGSTSASAALGLILGDTYVIKAQAWNASGTLIGEASEATKIGSNPTVTLNLLTPSSTWLSVSSWNPTFTPVIPAGGSLTVHFDMSDVLVSYLELSTSSTEPFYLQNEDGSILSPKNTIAGTNNQTLYEIEPSDLSSGGTGYLLTAYNSTSVDDTPGTVTFKFDLDPSKVNAMLYGFNQTTDTVKLDSLTEATGALTPVSSMTLPSSGYSWNSMVADPVNRRLFFEGTNTANAYQAMDGYTVATDGTLTEISGYPVSANYPFTKPLSAFASNGYFYWVVGATSLMSAPMTSGLVDFSHATTVLTPLPSGSPVALKADSGSSYLVLVTTSTIALYSPTASGGVAAVGVQDTLTTALSSASVPVVTAPSIGGLYAVDGATIQVAILGNTPNIQYYGRTSVTAPYSGGLLVANSKGSVAYLTQSTGTHLVTTPYSIDTSNGSTYGQLTSQTAATISASTASSKAAVLDPIDRYLVVSDGSNVYVADTSNSLSLVVSSPTSFDDLTVFRVK